MSRSWSTTTRGRRAQRGIPVHAVQGFQQILPPPPLVKDDDLGPRAGLRRGGASGVLQRPHGYREPAGLERVLEPAPVLGDPPTTRITGTLLPTV